ncbi:IQ motif and ubiquitin-like domain-containing protein [Centroberyx gerrardi]
MSDQSVNEEDEDKENLDPAEAAEAAETEETPETNPHPDCSTAAEPREDDRDPGSDAPARQAAMLDSGGLEEAASQTDLTDAEQHGDRTDDVGNSTATVKVRLVPEGHVMTVAFAIGLSIQELKRHFASELKVPAELLHVSLHGGVVEEQQSLMALGVQPHGSIQLEMSSSDPTGHPLRPLRPPQQDSMPDVITVRVHTDQGEFQQVVVEIERPPQQKLFLGGFRHRLTGAEFHHAAVQTPPRRRPDRGVAVFSRDTQTVEMRSRAQQCPVSTSTQMTGIGCYVSCQDDKLVAPGNYITADQYHDRRLRAVIRLQAFARRWQARRAVERLRMERDRRLAWQEQEQRRRREEKEEQLRDERRRWRNPQRGEDFTLLYHALERWRCEEEQRIDSSLRGAERKAALCSLLEQETQLIASIGRHRIAAQHNNRDKAVSSFLDKCAAPKRWTAADGQLTQMDSQQTVRARELRDLYCSVNMAAGSQEQRLDVLMTLKHTVKEQDCQLTRDMVELIDREADLMMRGVKETNLEGLRKRISTLFLQYIKTPSFNPQAANLLKVPQSPSQLKNDIFFCRGCRRYLRSAAFGPPAGARRAGRCRACAELDNNARRREDFSRYSGILSRLRADEQRVSGETGIPLLLQEQDVCHLVDVVWGCQSALSACSDLHDLVLVRWERRRDWSPWNCILLSKDETSAHLEVESVHEAYGETFVRSVEHKHAVARRHFSQIPAVAEYLRRQEAAAPGDRLVSRPITTATGKHPAGTSAH